MADGDFVFEQTEFTQTPYDVNNPNVFPNSGVTWNRELRSIYFFAEVSPESIMALLYFLDILDSDSDGDIFLQLNTNGGSIIDAWAAVSALRGLTSKVVVDVSGYCLSAGVMIYLACSTRLAYKKAVFLIHPETHFFTDNTDNLDIYAKYASELKDVLLEWMLERMGAVNAKGAKKAIKYFDGKEYWISAEKAHEAGIVTEVYDF